MVPSVKHLIAAGAGEQVAQEWIAFVHEACTRFDIQSPEQIAAFLAQVSHESAAFTRTAENLNYSAASLRRVFGRYFPDAASANSFAHQSKRIANRVYANRLGNGPESSGDGWKYRGRGLIQLTGRDNVKAYSTGVYGDERLVDDPRPLSEAKDASLSAGWFWNVHQLNQLADLGRFEIITELALEYHPDKTKGGKGAEDKFKDVNEANEVLSDPEKRKKYDKFGQDWKHYQEAGAQPGGFDWSKYAGGQGGQARRASPEEFNAMFGEEGKGDIFELLFGQRGGSRRGRRNAALKRGGPERGNDSFS